MKPRKASPNAAKTLENRVRLTLKRRGYRVEKSRLRDPLAIGYGVWTIYQGRKKVADFANLTELAAWVDAQR